MMVISNSKRYTSAIIIQLIWDRFFQTEADIFSNEEEILNLLERQEEVIAQARLMAKKINLKL